MPSRSRRTPEERAEARRRARYAARGEEDWESESVEEPAAQEGRERPSGGLLGRLFPPAPPLPGKPDPLAGFSYTGPMRGAAAGAYLVAANPRAWMLTGTIWAVGRLILAFGAVLGILSSLLSFGALIAAGWIGWQRPWLFGLIAALLGIVLYAAIWGALLHGHPIPDEPGTTYDGLDVFLVAVVNEIVGLQLLFGVAAGWYGGYLRRRMAATAPRNARREGTVRRR